jgi:sugar lactone lactonase YvrE
MQISPAGKTKAIAQLPALDNGYIGPFYDARSKVLLVAKYNSGKGHEILQVTLKGKVSTFVSNIPLPAGLAQDAQGNIYVTSSSCPGSLYMVTRAGSVRKLGSSLCRGDGIVIDATDNIYVGQRGARQVISISAKTGESTVIAEEIELPLALALDRAGKLYVADGQTGMIWLLDQGEKIAAACGMSQPSGMVFDRQGNLFVADYVANAVFKITASQLGDHSTC